jgi:hypothetical protein
MILLVIVRVQLFTVTRDSVCEYVYSASTKELRRTSQISLISILFLKQQEYAVAQLVEALRYKPERRGFDSRWCHWNFSLT